MEARESRLWLRIESGASQGKKVPLTERGLTIGRKSENELVLADGSVSGRHAEVRPDGGDFVLVDLGSTNGTKVGGARIETHRLAHGDHIHLGHVEAVFLDDALAAPAPAATGEAVGRISAERVAATGRRGLLGILALVVVAVGAVAAWWVLGRGSEGTEVTEVPEVPGNLLANGTFEDAENGPAWESAADASQGFFEDSEFAATGQLGLGVILEESEWALALSPLITLGSRQAYALRGELWAEDGARGRLGIRFSSSTGAGPDFTAWSRIVGAADDFVTAELVCAGLPGYDRARIVLAADATTPGALSVDDVSLVPTDAPADAVVRADALEAHLFGPGATTAAVVRSGRVICPGIDFAPWRGGKPAGFAEGAWTAAPEERGLSLTATGVPADATLEWTFYATERGDAAGDILLAAVGPDGYRSLASEFSVPAATDLLLGRGVDLIRLWFDEPRALEGNVRDGALQLRVAAAGTATFHLQISFVAEVTRAGQLADRAGDLEAVGDFGGALQEWSTLLDEVPFDATLVARAEAARARLVQDGMDRIAEIRTEVERARFFALAELFRQCRAQATAVGEGFRGSEVEAQATTLVGEIDGELTTLQVSAPEEKKEMLRTVLSALKEDEAPDLAARIREALGDDGTPHDHD